jgi:hypothetical protein
MLARALDGSWPKKSERPAHMGLGLGLGDDNGGGRGGGGGGGAGRTDLSAQLQDARTELRQRGLYVFYIIFSVAKYVHLEMKLYTLRPDIFTLNFNFTLSGTQTSRDQRSILI